MSADHYRTVEKNAVGEFKDRGSRFIAYVYPLRTLEEFKEKLKFLKKEHPKAAHHCFAYRIGVDGNNFRVSDDGEPSGSAGRPILGQIDSKEISNVLVVVVRYFGGTLLGVPGLINAYKSATAAALEANSIITKPVLVNYRLQFDYTKMNEVMRVIKKTDAEIVKQQLQLFCEMEIAVPLNRKNELLEELNGRGEEIATPV